MEGENNIQQWYILLRGMLFLGSMLRIIIVTKLAWEPIFSATTYLPEFTPTHVHRVSDAIQPSHSLLPPSPPALNLSQCQGLLSNESVLQIKWQKYWSFSFSISPSSEYTELMSFRIDWFDLLAVQETLKNLLQHHSSKASVLQHSVFFRVQLSYPLLEKKHSFDHTVLRWQSNDSAF